MSKSHTYTRPTFAEASQAWTALLQQRGLPSDLIWLFDENLCFEKDSGNAAGFKLAFQTAITPPPLEAEQVAYRYFASFDAPLVFYRVGSAKGKSICVLLCDQWFGDKHPGADVVRKDDWLIQFHPGAAGTIEEVTDEQRWKNRVLRNRPLQALDFCMTLRGVHEILAHGRVLTAYEHYALSLLHVWRRLFGDQH